MTPVNSRKNPGKSASTRISTSNFCSQPFGSGPPNPSPAKTQAQAYEARARG